MSRYIFRGMDCEVLLCIASLIEHEVRGTVEWYILRPARNSPNSRDHRQFNFVFIPSRKFSFSHHNNFSYDIKAYSPFRWSSAHFVRTSGAVLLIVEIHTCTFLPLLIPLDRNPFILGSYSMLIPHVRLGFCVWRHTRIWQSTLKYSERK